MSEPHSQKSTCPYCGDASVNHAVSFIEGSISSIMDPFLSYATPLAPPFIVRFVDNFIIAFLSVLSFFKIASFSTDIEKSLSYRTRVIWEEARRRGMEMEQVIIFGKPFELSRVRLNGSWFYFQSLPIPPKFIFDGDRWDDKIHLKRTLAVAGIPTPRFAKLSFFNRNAKAHAKLFHEVGSRLIVKPRVGSRGRHTTVNINREDELLEAIERGRMISPRLSVEEYLLGDVCRATVIGGKLAGFYRAGAPFVIGDGVRSVAELIEDKNTSRHERVEPISVTEEIKEYISRFGYSLGDVLPAGFKLSLTHRTGRFYGGETREMLDELHPTFVPILERAAEVLNLSIVGFDCIVPDPEKEESSQRWGIIESNTLPFIDLHYYALEGKPKNIAGMIWDLWE